MNPQRSMLVILALSDRFSHPHKGRGLRPLGLFSDLEDGLLAVLLTDNLSSVLQLSEQSRSLVLRDADCLTCISSSHTFRISEHLKQVALDSLIFLLSLCRLALTGSLANGLQSTLLEESEVLFCQSVKCDSVDSFCNSSLCHNVITFYLSFYIYSIHCFLEFVNTFFWRNLDCAILCFRFVLNLGYFYRLKSPTFHHSVLLRKEFPRFFKRGRLLTGTPTNGVYRVFLPFTLLV